MARKVWATRPYQYNGQQLDRGQVFEMANARNDERLELLGYLKPLEKGTQLHTCAECGAEFTGIQERTAHGRKRHPERPLTPEEEDRLLEREEQYLDQVAPVGI